MPARGRLSARPRERALIGGHVDRGTRGATGAERNPAAIDQHPAAAAQCKRRDHEIAGASLGVDHVVDQHLARPDRSRPCGFDRAGIACNGGVRTSTARVESVPAANASNSARFSSARCSCQRPNDSSNAIKHERQQRREQARARTVRDPILRGTIYCRPPRDSPRLGGRVEFKYLIVAILLLILISLGKALYHLSSSEPGDGGKMVKALGLAHRTRRWAVRAADRRLLPAAGSTPRRTSDARAGATASRRR